MDIKGLYNTAAAFVEKNRRYFGAGIVCAGMALMLAVGTTGAGDPIAGAYMSYEDQTQNEELKQLLTDYYEAYAAGDIDALEKVATPISDKEKSYIKLISKYIKSYDIKEIDTKPGVDKDALLVSVGVDIHYKKIDAAAPGLDFFYVEKDDKGNYVINNRYSTFNAQNGELDVDPTITTLIATFEQQDDVIALQSEVTQEFNTLTLEDKDFNVFFAKIMPEAVTDWAATYKKQEEKKAEKEKKKQEAAKKKAKEKEKEKAKEAKEEAKDDTDKETAKSDTAEDETDSAEKKTDTVVTKEKVNVRAKATTDSRALGQVHSGTELKRYKEKRGWSKIDYNGKAAWIKSEFLTVKDTDKDEDKDSAKDDTKKETTAKAEDTKKKTTEDKKSDAKEKEDTTEKSDTKKESTEKETVYAKEKVNVRTKASTSAKSLGQVNGGTQLVRYGEKDGWSQVEYNGGKAWIKSEYLTTKKPKGQEDEPEQDTSSNLSVGQTVRLSSSVNIRKSMNESASRVALVYQGDRVTIEAVYQNGWSKVEYNGKEGYMKTEFIK